MSVEFINQSFDKTPRAFEDKHFKSARVFIDYHTHVNQAIVYAIFAQIAKLFHCHYNVAHYKSLESYHWDVAQVHKRAYSLFGDKLVDFSVNRSKHTRRVNPGEGLPVMNGVYGKEKVDKFFSHFPSYLSTETDKLQPMSVDRGICFGESLEFICRYLQALKNGDSSRTAVKRIASHFAKGSSDEADLLHSLKYGFDIVETFKNLYENSDPIIKAIADEYQSGKVSEAEYIDQIFDHVVIATFGKILGMDFDSSFNGKSAENDVEQFKDLPSGAYLVCLSGKSFFGESGGHACVVIKDEEGNVVFDPNYGAIAEGHEGTFEAIKNAQSEFSECKTRIYKFK